jgi:hypothetical protein
MPVPYSVLWNGPPEPPGTMQALLDGSAAVLETNPLGLPCGWEIDSVLYGDGASIRWRSSVSTRPRPSRPMAKQTYVNFRDWICVVPNLRYPQGRPALQLLDMEDGTPVATATVNVLDLPLGNQVFVESWS